MIPRNPSISKNVGFMNQRCNPTSFLFYLSMPVLFLHSVYNKLNVVCQGINMSSRCQTFASTFGGRRPPYSSTSTRPHPYPPPRVWPRLLLSQTFACINNLAISSRVFLLLTPSTKMEHSEPKRQHIKFRSRGISQKKKKCSK